MIPAIYSTLFLALLAGCLSVLNDPVRSRDVAPCPSVIVTPPLREVACVDPICIDLEQEFTLAELIDLGLQNNPLTTQAWADAKSAAFNYYASESSYLPIIDVQEEGISDDVKFHFKDGGTAPAGISAGGYVQLFSSTLTVQYLLFDFGTRWGTVEAAKQALIAANWQHHFVLQEVMRDISQAYYDYLEAKAFVISSKKNLENAKTALDASQAQFEAGIKTKVDLLQAQANYLNAELDLENRKARKKVAMARLVQTVGLPANVVLKVADIPYKIESRPIDEGIEELMDAARRQRADLAVLEAQVWQRDADVEVAIGAALPTLSADVRLNRTLYAQSPITSSHDYSVALVLDIPLFSGFLDYNLIRRAKADYESAYYAWKVSESTILVEVITAYYQYVTANQNLKTSSEYLQFADESFQSILVGYQEGIQTILDLLAAQNVLADARAKEIQSRAAWLRAIVNIAYTTGLLGVNAEELSIATPEMLYPK